MGDPGGNPQSVRVFISYSWDSDEHKQRVLKLAEKLRNDGIEAWIDRYVQFPPEGWPRWMEDQIQQAQFVIIIATGNYARRFAGKAPAGTGLGVNWEGLLVTSQLYKAAGQNDKFLPAAFSDEDFAYIPEPLSTFSRFNVGRYSGYDELYRLLTGQPAVKAPPVGKKRELTGTDITAKLPALEIPAVHNHAARHSNLPRLPFGFYGRKKELEDIAEALAPGARTWGALIDGPGGMGKTALAIRAAELTPPGQFERIIFVTAKKNELTPEGAKKLANFSVPDYLAMLSVVARQMDLTEFGKVPEAERPAELQKALQNVRVLLIFDNLETLTEEDRDKLNDFLNRLPGACKAIITSRRRQEAYASIVRLESIEEDAAYDIINELARKNKLLTAADQDQRRSLFLTTGGNPLLIRWVAGQLGRGGCKTIPDALNLLHTAKTKNDPLEFIFGDLAVDFTENEARVLAALSHFTCFLDAKFIAALAGLDEPAAQEALDSLTNRALVNSDAEAARYAIIPLVAPYLKRARPEVVKLTGDNLCGWARMTIGQNGNQKFDSFVNLEAVWPQIIAAWPLLLEGDNARLQLVCNALMDFMNCSGHWDEMVFFFRQAEEKAVAAKDLRSAGWRAYHIGFVCHLVGQAADVIACADRAEKYWEEAGATNREKAFAIRLHGIGDRLGRNYPAAITAFTRAFDLYKSGAQESEDIAIILNDLAGAQRLDGRLEEAGRNYREALRVAGVVGYAEGIAFITGNLAGLALDREQWKEAEDLARQSLALGEKVQRKEVAALDRARLAKALARQGRKHEALPYIRDAVEILARLRHRELHMAQEILKECHS